MASLVQLLVTKALFLAKDVLNQICQSEWLMNVSLGGRDQSHSSFRVLLSSNRDESDSSAFHFIVIVPRELEIARLFFWVKRGNGNGREASKVDALRKTSRTANPVTRTASISLVSLVGRVFFFFCHWLRWQDKWTGAPAKKNRRVSFRLRRSVRYSPRAARSSPAIDCNCRRDWIIEMPPTVPAGLFVFFTFFSFFHPHWWWWNGRSWLARQESKKKGQRLSIHFFISSRFCSVLPDSSLLGRSMGRIFSLFLSFFLFLLLFYQVKTSKTQ